VWFGLWFKLDNTGAAETGFATLNFVVDFDMQQVQNNMLSYVS